MPAAQAIHRAIPDCGGCRALLACSQSTDPASPHAADQTERFMRKAWVTLPFTDAQIRADPALTHRHLAQ